jgi:hypothetical protein
MKQFKVAFLLVLVVLAIYGCGQSNVISDTKVVGVRDTGIMVTKPIELPKYQPVLDICNKILVGQKEKDKNKIMTAVAIESPDYQAMMKATDSVIKRDVAITSYACNVTYFKGDTARANVTINYMQGDKETANKVAWTFKNLKGNWYFWHGER